MADQKIGLAGGGAGKAQRDDRLIYHAVMRDLPGCGVFGDPGLAAFIRERGISSIDEVALFHAISENIAMGIVVRTENILRRSREIVLRLALRLERHRTLRRREIVELLAGVAEAAPSSSRGIADIDCPPRAGGPA
jgi:hypothetical protein